MMIEQMWYVGMAYLFIGFYLGMKNVSEIFNENNVEAKNNLGLIGFLIVLVTIGWPFIWLMGAYRDYKMRQLKKNLKKMEKMQERK